MNLALSNEVMHPDDFVQYIVGEVDNHNANKGYPEIWRRMLNSCNDEEKKEIIKHRLIKGYNQEIYIRDIAFYTLKMAPTLKAQQALIKQVEDEHKHAFWVADALKKKGTTAELTKPSVHIQTMWDAYYGMARNPQNFFVLLAAMQLVAERGFGLQSTFGFAEAIADIDPEVSELYLGKIRRDEIFHTVQLPESLIRDYAVTVEAQNEIRMGVQKGQILLQLLEADALSSKPKESA